MNTTHLLAWSARILGTALLVFLVFMLIGTLTGDSSEADGLRFRDTRDLIGFLLFPVCTIIGLTLAYRWPLLGGAIAVGSTVLLVILRPDLIQLTFLVMVLPGLLHLVHGLLQRSRVTSA
ncbi:MAG: hypothetical protein JNJ91_11810 [Flavobacteriales bacterium]|nr:hypothetical protein [Flavobacteriales bacterium]